MIDLTTRPFISSKLRNLDVLDSVRASGLLESIFFQVPIAQLTLRYPPDREIVLLDGDWRVSTLRSFLEDGFELEGMDYLPELNGKLFSELPVSLRRRITETKIRCIILDVCMTDEMCDRYVRQIKS